MHFTSPFLLALFGAALAGQINGSGVPFEKRAISSSTYNDLVLYFQYASSSYRDTASCTKPNGNTLISTISDEATDTQGFIARDDTRKEIVVALRGSSSAEDFNTDARAKLVPLVSPGINPPAGSTVHTGFLTAYNAVASAVLSTVKAQVAETPNYHLVTTGHSLGGSVAALAAISLLENFPGHIVRTYTYGQPRTFNPTGARFINEKLGSRVFRAVHTDDGVPTAFPQSAGYRHHGVEFWNFADPSSSNRTKECAADGEDATCSDAVPSRGVTAAHDVYFNIVVQTRFCS
ncbi:alpha/beta-hydrolase [Mycena vitilis]|nr:alpha/beta-hydrolase [Mycena vitilis]